MARPTYHCRILVLDKTAMGESDLVITALKQDGSLLRAVARGARKPTNPFAARLEIFAVCECLVAQGKNLDVFSEARTVDPNVHLRGDFNLSAAAYPVVQALEKACHEGLETPRLFDMARAALTGIDAAQAETAPGFTAAFLLKMFAMLGFRPSFVQCVSCGEPFDSAQAGGQVSFSYRDGGYVCRNCASALESVKVDASVISWAQALLMSTFADIADMHVGLDVSFPVLMLCHAWLRENMGLNLKSLNALLLYGSL